MGLPISAVQTTAESRTDLAGLGWRTLLSGPMSGPENMACDLALMSRARRTREAVLRVYSWSEPTLSFGRNQATDGYDRERMAAAGLAIVRRPTGGRAILHDREITYSVTAPVSAGESLSDAYAWINALLLEALRSLGVAARIAARVGRAPAPDANPCFATAAPGEIIFAGRKLVGSAQFRENAALLQHGSILVSDDQSSLAAIAGGGAAVPPATLEQARGRAPRPAELFEALRSALAAAGTHAESLPPDDVTEETARHIPTFSNPQWTWRR